MREGPVDADFFEMGGRVFAMRRRERSSAKGSVMTSGRESSEDYLEAILVIRRERGWCRNVDITERLGVTRPSVTKALAGLSSRSLVEVAGRDVRLTSEGRRLAGATLEKHEFFRRLLCDVGVDGRTTSEEACRLEHCISGPSFCRLADHLVSLRGQGGGG